MGQKSQTVPRGLYKRGRCWHIDKEINGQRISRSTGTPNLKAAIAVLDFVKEQSRQAAIFGVRPKRTFKEAAIKYIREEELNGKISVDNEKKYINSLMPFIGDLPIDEIHNETLTEYKIKRKQIPYIAGHGKKGKKKKWRKNQTINHGLKLVSQILKRAASEWRDENNLTWLSSAPKIKLLDEHDKRQPYPITWEEQDVLFNALPDHLRPLALFAVNTGCRDSEVCSLKWEWERRIPDLQTSVFVIPGFEIRDLVQDKDDDNEMIVNGFNQTVRLTKTGEDRLIVLNKIAMYIVDSMRENDSPYVFSHDGRRYYRINNTGWQRARKKVKLDHVRVHDLRHTFGRRLRAANISLEDRQDLLGHKSSRITTHYSAAEIGNLVNAVNKITDRKTCSPTLKMLRSRYDE